MKSKLLSSYFLISCAGILTFAGLNAHAQEQTSASPATHSAVLIPVGPRPDARWEGEGVHRQPVALDPLALPPRMLTVQRERNDLRLFTTVNRPTDPFRVLPGSLTILQHATDDPEAPPSPFHAVDIPEAPGHYDIFLTRDPLKADWADPRTMVIPGGDEAFPANRVRLVNLTDYPAAALINDQRVEISANATAQAELPDGRVSILCAYRDEESWQLVLRTRIDPGQQTRITVVIYPSRNEKQPCQATYFFQPDLQGDLP